MLRSLVAAALCAALATPAAAQARWVANLRGAEAAAVYGTPGDVRMSLECSGGTLLVDPRLALPRATMRVSVAFAIDGDEILRPATTAPEPDPTGYFPVYVRVGLDDRLVGALQHGERVRLSVVPGVPGLPAHVVPLRGSGDAIDAVAARC